MEELIISLPSSGCKRLRRDVNGRWKVETHWGTTWEYERELNEHEKMLVEAVLNSK